MQRKNKWIFRLSSLVLILVVLQLFGSCMQFRINDKKLLAEFDGTGITPSIERYELDQYPIRYVEVGEAEQPLVLFVHGAPGGLDAFIDYLKDGDLLKECRMISVDRPGYGYSNFGKSVTSIEKQAALLKPIIEKATKPIILVGHSYGGPIVARMAMDYPELVDAIIMAAPAIDPDNEKMFWVNKPGNWPIIRNIIPRSFRVANEEKLSHADELRLMLPLWPSMKTPTTLIQGGKDRLVHPINADFGERVITNAPFELIRRPDLNHFFIWTEPDLITDAIRKYLK